MSEHETCGAWLTLLRRYLAFMAGANLVWEVAHLPLYTLWATGSATRIAWFLLRCTAGDVLIALASLVLALLLLDERRWPFAGFARAAALAVAFGVAYTAFSEWLNTRVLETWAYSDLMPVLPVVGVGLSALAQWLTLPLLGFWWAARPLRQASGHGRCPCRHAPRARPPVTFS